jgi:hypothetical protein
MSRSHGLGFWSIDLQAVEVKEAADDDGLAASNLKAVKEEDKEEGRDELLYDKDDDGTFSNMAFDKEEDKEEPHM